MISRSDRGNFIVTHYDWIAAGVGVLALLGAVVFLFLGDGVEQEIADATASIEAGRSPRAVVAVENMTAYVAATNMTKTRERAAYVLERSLGTGKDQPTLFASDLRLLCMKCERATPKRMDADRNVVCIFCGATQEVAKAEAVLDTDGDGMPDEWEKRFGLNPNGATDADEDKDGDGFTNLEEYQAKTDPTDKNDHLDYLDSLTLTLPLRETTLPFVFTKATKIPTGWRCEFFHAREKDDYGRLGRTITAVIGEEIGTSGFVLKSYTPKDAKVAIKGGEGLEKTVDVSEATIERKSDGKQLTLVIVANKKAKPSAVDVQATLAYSRGGGRNFDVIPGSEIVLSGSRYRITEIKAVGKGGRVTVENVLSGKKRTLEALER